jgi:hypothetical protein
MKSYIAFHEDKGIYLGVFAGHALFSASPIAFSSKAIRFEEEQDVYKFFDKSLPNISNEIVALEVDTTYAGNYVDVVDIIKSGHKKHVSSMVDNMPMKSETIH